MARIARDPVDVILGEATRGSWAERYNDMLAIASVIHNRAQSGRVSYQDVVGVKSQFNAYGKSLPRGVENYRTLAQMALQQVQKHGPIHNATYYATPKAAKNLPEGLQPVTKTAGHVYFSDPKGRSFQTAKGYVSPAPISTSLTDPVTPATAPVPSQAPRGLGMAALAPNGLRAAAPGTPIASYDRTNLHPSLNPMMDALAANPTFAGVPVNSGYRSPAANAAARGASRSQHLGGRALDLNISNLSIPDRVSLLDAAIEKGNAKGIGIYPGERTMHVDTRANPSIWGQNPAGAFARMSVEQAPDWAQPALAGMIGAGPFSVTPRTTAPTPTTREAGLAMPAPAAPTQRQAEAQSMEALAALAPQSPADAYAQLASTMEQAGVRGLGVQPQSVAQPVASPVTTPAPVQQPIALPPATPRAVPSLMAPQVAPQLAPQIETPSMRTAPTGLDAIQGLFTAPEGEIAKPSWEPDTTFTSLGDGRVSMTNKYGVTRDVTSDWGMTPRQEAQERANSTGPLGRVGGALSDAFGPGGAGRGMLGGMAGSALGGALAGPLGAMALGAIGRNVAMGNGPLGRGQGYNFSFGRNASPLGRNEMSGLLGGFTPGLAFPSMPAPPTHNNPYAGGNSPSYSDMAGISPAAAAAISEGRAGLY